MLLRNFLALYILMQLTVLCMSSFGLKVKNGGSIWALVWTINIICWNFITPSEQLALVVSSSLEEQLVQVPILACFFLFCLIATKINNNKLYLMLAPKLLDDELVFHKLYALLNLTGKEWNYPEATWCSAIFKQAEVAEDEWQIKPWCYVGYWCAGISRFVCVFSVLDGFVVLPTRMSKVDTFGLADKFNVILHVFSYKFLP